MLVLMLQTRSGEAAVWERRDQRCGFVACDSEILSAREKTARQLMGGYIRRIICGSGAPIIDSWASARFVIR
jgi:hypothetical protein